MTSRLGTGMSQTFFHSVLSDFLTVYRKSGTRCYRYFTNTPLLGRVPGVVGHNGHLIYNDIGQEYARVTKKCHIKDDFFRSLLPILEVFGQFFFTAL
jgi:hypothetical protein